MNGDVKLKDKNIPMIFWNGIWSPICGHYFWDNQIGAMLFCQKLGFEDGRVSGQRSGNSYTSDSFMVGKCNKGDTWTKCSGRCNRCSLGNCHQGPKCTRKQPVKIEIKCTGNTVLLIQTDKGIFHKRSISAIICILFQVDLQFQQRQCIQVSNIKSIK